MSSSLAPDRSEGSAPPTPPPHGLAERWARSVYGWITRSQVRLEALRARVPRLIRVLRTVYYPLALLLVGFVAYRASRRLDLSSLRLAPFVAAYLVALVWWLALAAGWSTLLTERVRIEPAAAWCRTQVARYIPGGIWAPIARATTVRGRARDKAAAVLAENVIVLCVALAAGAVWVSIHDPRWLPLALIIAVPLVGGRWLERRASVTHRAVRRTAGTYSLGYLAYGFIGILSQITVSGLRHPTYPLYLAGASCVAWAVGLVVVFAPGGIGVREVVYIWMLHGLYPRAELEAAAVTARVVTVFAELTVLAAVVWWSARARPSTRSTA